MMYKFTMTRTQIYLPQQQLQLLKQTAVMQGDSVSGIIRKLIKQGFEQKRQKKTKKTAGETLLELADRMEKLGVKGPRDLASRLDFYLYGSV